VTTKRQEGHEWDYWPEPGGEPFTDKDGWEEGTLVRCTPRAKRSWPMWHIEAK
jgi:hypothetical protein